MSAPPSAPADAAAAPSSVHSPRAIKLSTRAHSMSGAITSSASQPAATAAAAVVVVPGSRSARSSATTPSAAAAAIAAAAAANSMRIHTIRAGQRRASTPLAPSATNGNNATAAASAQVQGSGTPATPAAASPAAPTKRIIAPTPLVLPSPSSSTGRVASDDHGSATDFAAFANVIVTPPPLKLFVGKLSPKLTPVLAAVSGSAPPPAAEAAGTTAPGAPAFYVPGQMADPLASYAEAEKMLLEAFSSVAADSSPLMTPLKSPTPELPPSFSRRASASAAAGGGGNGNVTPRMAGQHTPMQLPHSLGTIMSPAPGAAASSNRPAVPLHPNTHGGAAVQSAVALHVHPQASPSSTHHVSTASPSSSPSASPTSANHAPPAVFPLSVTSPSAASAAAASAGVKRAMSRGPGSPMNGPAASSRSPKQRAAVSSAAAPPVPLRFAFPTFRPDGDIDTKYANQLHVARKRLLSKYLLGFALIYALMEIPYMLNSSQWEAHRHFVPLVLRLAVVALFALAVYVNSRLFVARYITQTTWRFDTLCCGLMSTAAVLLVAMETQRSPAPIDVPLTFDGSGNALTWTTIQPPLDPVLQDGLLLGLTLIYTFTAGILKIRLLLFVALGCVSMISYTVAILLEEHRSQRYLLLSLAYQLLVLSALTYMVFCNERLKARTLTHQKFQYLERKKAEKLLRSMLPERILNDYLDASVGQLQAIATIGFVQMHLGAWAEAEVVPPGKDALSEPLLQHPHELAAAPPALPPPPVASPGELMQKLHDTFKRIDGIVNVYAVRGVNKIETVSTTYLLCAGLLQLHEIDDHAAAMIDVSLEILSMVQSRGGIGGRGANGRGKQRIPVLLRIGISSGSVVGGIIGDQRRFFRVFGDTVNVSARMCTTTAMGSIQISEASYDSLTERQRASYKIPPPIVRDIKGKGLMRCYTIESRADWVAKFNKTVMSRGQLDRDEPLLNKSFVYHKLVQITDLRTWSLGFKQTGSLGAHGAKIAVAALEEDQRKARLKLMQQRKPSMIPSSSLGGGGGGGTSTTGKSLKPGPVVITGVVPSSSPPNNTSRPPRVRRPSASHSQSISITESMSEGPAVSLGGVGGTTLLAPTPTAHRRGRSGNMLQTLLGNKSEGQMHEAAATAATGLALVSDIGQDPIRNSKRHPSTGAKDRLRSQLKQAHLLGTSSALQQTLDDHPFSAAAIERFFQLKFARQFLREVRWSNLIFLAFEIGLLIYVVVYHNPDTRDIADSTGKLESDRANLSPSILASILVAIFVAFDAASILRAGAFDSWFSCCTGRCRGGGGVGDENDIAEREAARRHQAQLSSSSPLPLSILTDSLGGTDGAFAPSSATAGVNATSHFARHFQRYALAFASLLTVWVLVILSLGGVDHRTAEIHPVFAMLLVQLYACLSLRLQFRMLAPLMVAGLLAFAVILAAERHSYVHMLLILSHLAAALFLGLNVLYHFERASRSNFLLAYALEKEQEHMDRFLHNLLPRDVVNLLKKQNPAKTMAGGNRSSIVGATASAMANAGGGFLAVDRATSVVPAGSTSDGGRAVSPPPMTPSPGPGGGNSSSMISGDAGLASRFAMHFPTCTVYESDIVGYTKMVSSLSPSETLNLLNLIFSRFDEVSLALGVEKIETIGDAFMCMVFDGSPDPVLDFALTIVPVLANCSRDCSPPQNLQIRMGISTGSCFGGIVGTEIPRFHLFGSAHDVAIHIEQNGRAGDIIVSSSSYDLSQERYDYQKLPELVVDGFQTYLLVGKKGGVASSPTGGLMRRGSMPLPYTAGHVAATTGPNSLRKSASVAQTPSSMIARSNAVAAVAVTHERKLAPSSQQQSTLAAASSSSSSSSSPAPSASPVAAAAASTDVVEMVPFHALTVSADRRSDSSIVRSLGGGSGGGLATQTTQTTSSSSSGSGGSETASITATHRHHSRDTPSMGNGSTPSSPFAGAGAMAAAAASGKRGTPPSASASASGATLSRLVSTGSNGGANIKILRAASSTGAVTGAATPLSPSAVISSQQFVDPVTLS